MQFKVIVTFKENLHLISVAKVIEKEAGKIVFAKYLNNKRILIHAVNRTQQEKILKMKMLINKQNGNKTETLSVMIELEDKMPNKVMLEALKKVPAVTKPRQTYGNKLA
ncbi:Elongation factor P [Labeo rohita]|uniref:Elongation factor P n=1 Tax=Labeo rohita TaxID=84645 RepID=A0ABQ8LZ29_LABRO|nr:Elongation factor P [Labeo rohita]